MYALCVQILKAWSQRSYPGTTAALMAKIMPGHGQAHADNFVEPCLVNLIYMPVSPPTKALQRAPAQEVP
jgi:hypothetical protein